jgi:uncharacterized protein (TIGR02646 family)
MIPLKRIRTNQAIKEKYRGTEKHKRDIELVKAQRAVLSGQLSKIVFDSSFWTQSKNQLKKESSGKCAYCEANTQVVAHGDVEHYRPKSIYWWLAYTYDNYLYACQICNQKYKSDNFPFKGVLFPGPQILANLTDSTLALLAGNISPDPVDINNFFTLQTYLANHQQERALLLNPYFDNPADYMAYEADNTLEEVKIIPLTPAFQDHIKAMEDFYGINRVELRTTRYEIFRFFSIIKKSLASITDMQLRKDMLKQIEIMKADKALFAGMIRYFDTIL